MALTIRTDDFHRETDCAECGEGCRELVWAVNVNDQRGPDGYGYAGDYQHVDRDDLREGASLATDQCGSCGSWGFEVIRSGNRWVARCAGDNDTGTEGCNTVYPIIRMQSHYVVF